MPERDIIVVGASAGGLESLTKLVSGLPTNFPASIFVVQHLSPHVETSLPEILSRASKLNISLAKENGKFEKGHIYIAPPDKHLILNSDKMKLVRGPKENFSRPSVDVLFRSAAVEYGPRVIGVILSGNLGDGTNGLNEIKAAGGIAIIQDPLEAKHPSMPLSAAQEVSIDASLPVLKIADQLTKLVNAPMKTRVKPKKSNKKLAEKELEIAELNRTTSDGEQIGDPSGYSCPECKGVLGEIKDGNPVRFRCRTGHAYLPEILSERQSETIETSLWAGFTALEEKSSLSLRLAKKFSQFGDIAAADRFRAKSEDALAKAKILRNILTIEEPK